MKITRNKIIVAAAVLLVALGAWFFSGSENGEIKVLETGKVTRGKVRKVLEATGIVQAQVGASVKIGARATGFLSRVPVKVGDKVAKGQLVAEIDDRELQAKRAEAEAQLKLAQAKYRLASKNLPRRQKLVQQNLDSQSTLDEAVQESQVARWQVEAARASLETLDIQISYTKIYSPIDGVVSQVAAQEGETVVAGLQVANLITVLDQSRLEMWIYVDETDVGRTKEGQEVEFRVDAYPDRVFKGRVDRVYPEPEVRDNIVYYQALVRLDKDQAEPLRPEMTTQCRIVVESKDDVLLVPNTALKWVKGRQVVYVADEAGKTVEVEPELGLEGLEESEVVSGLSEGQTVATQLVLPGKALGQKGI